MAGNHCFFFLVSALVGFSGQYTRFSKVKALLFGLGGTFLVNIFRISLVAILAYFLGHFPALIFHDYGSLFILVAWMITFWWFSYSFVLEE